MEFLTKLVKKADRNPTKAVNFLLGELDTWWNLSNSQDEDEKDAHKQIWILKVELRLLKTFLICVGGWNALYKDVGLLLQSPVQDLEAACVEATTDFRFASSENEIQRSVQYLYPVISKWQQKFKLFRPLIKAAYDYVSSNQEHCSFQSQSPLVSYSPLSNYVLWDDFSGSLQDNLIDLSKEDTFLVLIKPHIQVMAKMIRNLRVFMQIERWNANQQEYRHLLTHFRAILVKTAHISYVCWIDGMDENMTSELIPKLVDLLKKLKLNTSQVTRILKDNSYNCADFVQFLIPQKQQLLTLQEGLKYLIMLVIQPPSFYTDNDVKLLSMDVIEMVSDLGSFSYLFHAEETIADLAKDAYPLLFKLLEKMELLNAELFLIELLQPGIMQESLVKNRINSFHDGLSFLRIFLGDDDRKIPRPIWKNVGSLATDAGDVYLAFLRKSVTKDKATFELLKLLERIKLSKMEILLQELLNSRPNMMVDMQNQIQTLYEGLTVLRTFLMGPLEEDGNSILAHVELVVRDVISVFCSFDANKVTEDMATNLVLLLPKLVEMIEPVNAGIKKIYLQARSSFKSSFPKTDGVGFMDFLIGNLMELLNSKAEPIGSLKYPIQIVYGEMGLLRSILCSIGEKWTQHWDMKSLVSRIIQVAYEVEHLVDSFVVRGGVLWYHALWVTDLIEDIRLLKIKASEISVKTCGISNSNGPKALSKVTSPAKIPKIDEGVIDVADQSKMIDRLTRGSLQQDVVSIVGMPGLGKTTLARKVYNDPSVIFHFYIRAWCSVSQVYCKRDLLLEMLGDIVDITDSILEMSDDDLELELYQCLKRKRYLIVIDDIWSIEAWYDLERMFPNDENGSRILITSRLRDVALKIKPDRIPHPLRLLSHDESWELLQKKLFKSKDCPVELVTVGNQIAKSCQGLPLAIVAISGILGRTEMTLDSWQKVSESLCSRIASDPQTGCKEILELSYNHLPDYLKPCFLYLGAFLENKEIPVRKLTRLWVAEGFVRSTGLEGVEDLAEEYLRDLIGRSLVIASKSRSNGGVKTCRVHDMLHTLCLLRCQEENFLHLVSGYNFLSATSYDDSDYGVDPGYHYPTNCVTYAERRLSICSKRNQFVISRPCGPHVRSLLYTASSDLYPRCPYNISFIYDNFKLLRVLDLECINMGNSFFSGIELLAHLRYLAICGDIDYIPESIANLWNLETLIVKGLKGKVLLPDSIWSMEDLTHLHVYGSAVFSMQDNEMENASQSENLVSLSTPSLSYGKHTENIMRRLLKLRRLGCLFSESRIDVGNSNQFPVLNFLTELESLKILYSGRISHPCKFDFPLKLKKLTLSNFRLPWDCISEVGRLPSLEVLKLLSKAFEGKLWDVKEGEFPKLKFLKLDTLNLAQWNASSDDFPSLQHLVLRNCRQLEEVPSGLGDVPTLDIIQVQLCRQSAEESVRRIKEEQRMMGNDHLKVLINRSEQDF